MADVHYDIPTSKRETKEQGLESVETVTTWLRNPDGSVVREPKDACIYDNEFSYYVNREDLEAYSKSFDFSNEEQEEFLKTLKKKI